MRSDIEAKSKIPSENQNVEGNFNANLTKTEQGHKEEVEEEEDVN